jgi:HlyD family secretion protein
MSKADSTVLPALLGSRKIDPTLPAILEFQQPSTAIVNAQVPISARYVVWIVASMVLVMIVLSAVIPVDQVVPVRGLVVSESATILVQPLETAIVRSIDVREGQRVKAGQLLARLDPTFAASDLAAIEAQVGSLEAERARLKAETEGKPFVYTGDDVNWNLQLSIFNDRKAQFDLKLENYDHRLHELDAVIARSEADAAGYRERLKVAQTIEDMRRQLEASQVGSKLNSLIAKDSRVEMERALSNAEQSAEGGKRDRAAMVAERDGYIRGFQADNAQKLQDTSRKASDARELFNKAKLRRELVELKSGVDAIVQSVARVSVGSVMQSGQQFITLVPIDAPLEVEANISGRDNGFVHVNDAVSIKFDTFPYSQYGMAEGKVRIVSPDSFNAQTEARNPTSALAAVTTEPFYRSRISIDKVGLHDVPDGFRLIPGMPVTADIKVGKRTIMQYLLGMMLPVAHEAMREP